MNKTVKGLNINYICEGEGELVLLLHGWGSNIKLFDAMINVLKTKYKVLAMDMPGFGESEEPEEPWCVDDYVDFVLEFLKDYEFDKITLLGHSFGGRVIIKLCSRDLPFEVEKTILVDAAGVKPKKSLKQKIKEKIYFLVLKEEIMFDKAILLNTRQTQILHECESIVQQIEESKFASMDITAMLIKNLWNTLGKITGECENENIIDLIFSKFCLGK